jgi:hypothetical protein
MPVSSQAHTIAHAERPYRPRLWLGPAVLLLTATAIALSLELAAHVALDPEQRAMLPHFGLPQETQARLAWLDWQQQRSRYGTTSYPSSFDLPDPMLGWRVRPNASARHVKPGMYDVAVHTNNAGLRGLEPVSPAKTPGRPRIGVFGCSQTFGESVDDTDTYVARLAGTHPNAEFLNFGVRGYGTDQMLLLYEEEGASYDLDVVVLAFAFYHMKRNATGFLFYAKPRFELADDGTLELVGTPVPMPEQLAAQDAGSATWNIADRSSFARWLWGRLVALRVRRQLAEQGEAWKLSEALIRRFVDSVRHTGSRPVLVNIDEARPDLEDDLTELAAELGVDLVNLGPVLREAQAAGEPYTLPNDNHWNAEGHRLVATELEAHLCAHGLVPGCAS